MFFVSELMMVARRVPYGVKVAKEHRAGSISAADA
jgi:hypothetical protein